jgi:hypothetical protein
MRALSLSLGLARLVLGGCCPIDLGFESKQRSAHIAPQAHSGPLFHCV